VIREALGFCSAALRLSLLDERTSKGVTGSDPVRGIQTTVSLLAFDLLDLDGKPFRRARWPSGSNECSVEGEALVALMIEKMLAELGFNVVASTSVYVRQPT
jgi:hypothetical protein